MGLQSMGCWLTISCRVVWEGLSISVIWTGTWRKWGCEPCGWGWSIPEQKPWSRRVHNVLQEKQGPMLLVGKSGERRWSLWGTRSRTVLEGTLRAPDFTPLWEARRGFSAGVRGDQLGGCCNNLGEKQWCTDQAGNRRGGKNHLALDVVFRSQKDVNCRETGKDEPKIFSLSNEKDRVAY